MYQFLSQFLSQSFFYFNNFNVNSNNSK